MGSLESQGTFDPQSGGRDGMDKCRWSTLWRCRLDLSHLNLKLLSTSFSVVKELCGIGLAHPPLRLHIPQLCPMTSLQFRAPLFSTFLTTR